MKRKNGKRTKRRAGQVLLRLCTAFLLLLTAAVIAGGLFVRANFDLTPHCWRCQRSARRPC